VLHFNLFNLFADR